MGIKEENENAVKLAAVPTYKSFKAQLDKELTRAAESFVRIGYLLKIARDTTILHESGYDNLVDFAKVEYGLHKDQVSRFIAVHDRFSDGGEHLAEKYREFGYAKLTEMLTLPDAVVENLSPKITRSQTQEIKREIRKENEITDIEVILEKQDARQQEYAPLEKYLDQFFLEHREAFERISEIVARELDNSEEGHAADIIIHAMEPYGVGMPMVRIQGVGKLGMSFRGKAQNPVLINMRTDESEEVEWLLIADTIRAMFGEKGGKAGWEAHYHRPFEEGKCPSPTGGIPKTDTPPAMEEKKKEKTAESPIKLKADTDSVPDVVEQADEMTETGIKPKADIDLNETGNEMEPVAAETTTDAQEETYPVQQEEAPERADAMEEYVVRVDMELAAEKISMTLKDFDEAEKIPAYAMEILERNKKELDRNWDIWRKMVM